VGLAVITALGLVTAASPAFASGSSSVIYSSLVDPWPGNLPSVGAEAYYFNELGNEVTFSGTNRQVNTVIVGLSSWGCVTGHWYSGDCVTPAGATFKEPITFNIYGPSTNGLTPGALIASATQTFSIPYRPSANPYRCTGGEWHDSRLNSCFNGFATTITFHFDNVTLPNEIVYGIAYNTSTNGYHPYGYATACYTSSGGCGYDSLNIALSQDPTNVTVGGDPNPGTIWQYSNYGNEYCDNGLAGTGVFRLDSPTNACWGVNTPNSPPYYVPEVQFTASALGN